MFKLKERSGGHKVASHVDENGREVKPGDVIESSSDLEKLFRNKFERMPETVQGPIPKPSIPIPLPGQSIEDKGGVDADTSQTPPDSPDSKDKDEEKTEGEYGKDVSALFPVAGEVEMKVFEKNHWYTVVDTEDGEVMNEKKKLRKEEVTGFLEQYREEA